MLHIRCPIRDSSTAQEQRPCSMFVTKRGKQKMNPFFYVKNVSDFAFARSIRPLPVLHTLQTVGSHVVAFAEMPIRALCKCIQVTRFFLGFFFAVHLFYQLAISCIDTYGRLPHERFLTSGFWAKNFNH